MFAANRDDHVAAELTPVEINRSGNSAKSFLTGKVGVMSPASVSRTSCDIVWNTRRRAPYRYTHLQKRGRRQRC
jgi:hypothetical protein